MYNQKAKAAAMKMSWCGMCLPRCYINQSGGGGVVGG